MSSEQKFPKIRLLRPSTEFFEIDPEKLIPTFNSGQTRGEIFYFSPQLYLQARNEGSLKGKAIYLSNVYCWKIVKDENGADCLIAYNKY